MPKFRFPWYRVAVMTLLVGLLAWWMTARRPPAGDGEGLPAARSGIRTPAGQEQPVVVLDVLPHAVPEGETPLFWLRVGNVAYDVPVPAAGADSDLARQARELREDVFEALRDEVEALRREAPDPDALIGEVRRGKSVPAALYMAAFQLFVEAGYGKVNVALTEAKPPGLPPR